MRTNPDPAIDYIFHLFARKYAIISCSENSQIWHRNFQCTDRGSITFTTSSVADGAKISKYLFAI